jgi:hypothetical protein
MFKYICILMYSKKKVGFMAQGIIASLPRPKFKVLVFKIESGSEEFVDEVSQHIEVCFFFTLSICCTGKK